MEIQAGKQLGAGVKVAVRVGVGQPGHAVGVGGGAPTPKVTQSSFKLRTELGCSTAPGIKVGDQLLECQALNMRNAGRWVMRVVGP